MVSARRVVTQHHCLNETNNMQDSKPDNAWRNGSGGGIILCAMLLASVALNQPASAQNYPSRPIRLMSASAPGSGSDVIARLLSGRLAENFGQQVVVDNRPGASGMIGAELTAKAAPDGHTFWMPT